MALDLITGKQVFIETIQKDIRHQDYKRVCELADEYSAYITGEDVKSLLKQFSPRESDDQFDQRVTITSLITPYIANRIMNPMYKVGRTLATKTLNWEKVENADENKKKLNEAIAAYAGDESLDDYLTHMMPDLDSMDSNAFMVTDFEGKVDPTKPDARPEPYPLVFSSKEAINYRYKNNKLQFLIVLFQVSGLNRFTIYLENEAIIAQQITEEEYKSFIPEKNQEILFKDPDKKATGDIYVLTVVQHLAGRIPAIRVGHKKDPKTKNRTCVPLIHPARSFFKKSVKTISEFDLTNSLHVFPQKIQYDSVCPGDISNQVICTDGKAPDGSSCKICKGTGFNEHKSASDILRVKMPGDLKEVVSLENFIAYKHPSIDILKFMKELGLYEFPDLATKAVYTSELYTADSITTTATEKVIDLESVYDTLKPFADKFSAVYKHTAAILAAYNDVDKGINIDHKFPKDFKMKPLTALLEDLQKANTSGAPSYIKKEINRDIAQKLYVDKPEELMKIEVKEKFYPFNGKSENDINTIINNNLASKFNQVLYANYDSIFDELAQENTSDTVSFWKMETSVQKELLKLKVQQYMLEIDEDQAGQRAGAFGTAPDGEAGAGETQDFNAGERVQHMGATVEVLTANPGRDGGMYKIRMPDGTEKDVMGKELMMFEGEQ